MAAENLGHPHIRQIHTNFNIKKEALHTHGCAHRASGGSPEGLRSKDQGRSQSSKSKGLRYLRGDRSGTVVVEAVGEPAVAPAPAAVVPVEIAHAEVAVRVAVDRAPEEHELPLPLLGNEGGVGEQVVQNASVQDRLVGKLLAKLVADDRLARSLILGQIEFDPGVVPLQLSALLVLFHLPAVGQTGVFIAVDEMLRQGDLGLPPREEQEHSEFGVRTQLGDVIGGETLGFQSVTELVHLADGKQGRHRPLLRFWTRSFLNLSGSRAIDHRYWQS